MTAVPSPELLLVAALLLLVLPLKTGLYFWLLARFRVRARAAALASQSLANFSEFGLIARRGVGTERPCRQPLHRAAALADALRAPRATGRRRDYPF